MTRLLIVDDDPAQLRSLARVINVRRPDLDVLVANDGSDAIETLQDTAVEVVLTDLQMPGVNGFDLLAWMLSNQPHVVVFAMTAFPDSEAASRLGDLGNVECFTKPLDVPSMLERVTTLLAQSVRGHVQNLSLAAFLQLIEMERKTCTLTVESGEHIGYLYVRAGTLVDAHCRSADGELAALQIIGWPAPAITIMGTCPTTVQTIHSPMGFIIMEAMRVKDEAHRCGDEPLADGDAGRLADLDLDLEDIPPEMPGSTALAVQAPTVAVGAEDPPATEVARAAVPELPSTLPSGAEALAFVDANSGNITKSLGGEEHVSGAATLAEVIYRKSLFTNTLLKIDDPIEEITITAKHWWIIVRPLAHLSHLAVLLFDPTRVHLAHARERLTAVLDPEGGGL